MKNSAQTLVLIYNSFGDPLFQNLILAYLKTLSDHTEGDFHLITFEQPEYFLNSEQRRLITSRLSKKRIYWHPLDFHSGNFLLFWKTWDFLQAFFMVLRLWYRYKLKVIFCFANVSASIGIVLKKLFKLKMIVYSYEPHSQFMADLGYWKKGDLKYILLNYLENLAGRDADYIMTGTRHMVDHLVASGSKAKVFRAPTAVDDSAFYFRPEGRKKVRNSFGLKDEKAILYLGKFGGLYYTYEIPALFQSILEQVPNAFFLVVTSNDKSEIEDLFLQYLPSNKFCIKGNLTFDEVKDHISAADLGVSGVPPSPSQKFRSPTKVAEYLLCGVPYITTSGVAEDDEVAQSHQVGMVLNDFSNGLSSKNIDRLNVLLNENRKHQREHCREVGLNYRSKPRIDQILQEIYSQL